MYFKYSKFTGFCLVLFLQTIVSANEFQFLENYPNIFKPEDITRTVAELQNDGYSIIPFQEIPAIISELRNFIHTILVLKKLDENQPSMLDNIFLSKELRNLSDIFLRIITLQNTSTYKLIEAYSPFVCIEIEGEKKNQRKIRFREPLKEVVWHTHPGFYTVIIPLITPTTLLNINGIEQSFSPHTALLIREDIRHSSPVNFTSSLRSLIMFSFEKNSHRIYIKTPARNIEASRNPVIQSSIFFKKILHKLL